MKPFKLLGWAAALLAVAFPAAAGVVLAWLTFLAALLLGHLTIVCATAALVLLVRAARGLRRRPPGRVRRLLDQATARADGLNSSATPST